jgi:hypothetical protein
VLESGRQWEAYHKQISDAMYGTDGAVPTIEGAVDDMAAEVGEAPGRMADELLANQQRLADATTELVNFMEQALTPAQEMARLQGFLASVELAQGLASNNPLVRQKARELRDEAAARLQELTPLAADAGYDAGTAFHVSLAAAMGATRWMVYAEAVRTASAIRGVMPSSEPKDPNSPLRGITKGFGFGEVLARGILSGQGAVASAFRSMVGVTMPTAGGMVSVGAGSGATTINNFYFQWEGEPPQGRTEAEIIAVLQRVLPLTTELRGI